MSRKLSLPSLTMLAIGVHALLFLATALYLIVYGRNDIAGVSWSLTFYYENASRAVFGLVPYRDFPFEYPVLSFPLFLIPRLLVADLSAYKVAFVAEMLAFDAVAIYLIARYVRDREGLENVPGRLVWYTVYCASLSPLVIGRFELAPMLLAFAAALWWFSGWAVLGGFTAGLGTLVKVFPGVIGALGLVMAVSRRRVTRMHGTLTFLVTVILGLAGWLALGGLRTLDSVGYHAARGLEIESIYGAGLFLHGLITGTEVPWEFSYKAFHIAPEWGEWISRLALPIQAATILLVLFQFRRSGMNDGLRFSAAAITAFIVTGKVLSPQYLIWLFPFLVVLGGWTGSRARWLFLFCCLMTALIYPGPGFLHVLDHQASAILLLNGRNVLLVALLALLASGPSAAQRPTPSTTAADFDR
jgi:Glycosyltransferase family 87